MSIVYNSMKDIESKFSSLSLSPYRNFLNRNTDIYPNNTDIYENFIFDDL